MKKTKVVEMRNPELEARNKFSQHVQSAAFHLKLSRRMIDTLQLIRDHGCPNYYAVETLVRRGLAFECPDGFNAKNNWAGPGFALSKLGLMICDLLVESEMMPKPQSRPATAKKVRA